MLTMTMTTTEWVWGSFGVAGELRTFYYNTSDNRIILVYRKLTSYCARARVYTGRELMSS